MPLLCVNSSFLFFFFVILSQYSRNINVFAFTRRMSAQGVSSCCVDGVELFVPGRVCLLGEHTDWAALYRNRFPDEPACPGHCLVYGTDCGIYATAKRVKRCSVQDDTKQLLCFACVVQHAPAEVHFTTVHEAGGSATYVVNPQDGSMRAELRVSLDDSADGSLARIARSGTFFSYVAGTALTMLRSFASAFAAQSDFDLSIENTKTDLPVGKGISSSAAVCVLVVRALARLCGIALTVSDEMELAFLGERETPSQCGRMDQCVAFGKQLVLMHFSSDDSSDSASSQSRSVSCEAVKLSDGVQGPLAEFFFVVADMNRGKDTQRILADLTSCYTDASLRATSAAATARHFLGTLSNEYVVSAVAAMTAGRPDALGKVFVEYQADFDRCLQPVCPSQLTAPRLHELLSLPALDALTFGGKGVGSQGDGSVQFVCRDAESQKAVMQILEDEGCHCFAFTLRGAS